MGHIYHHNVEGRYTGVLLIVKPTLDDTLHKDALEEMKRRAGEVEVIVTYNADVSIIDRATFEKWKKEGLEPEEPQTWEEYVRCHVWPTQIVCVLFRSKGGEE